MLSGIRVSLFLASRAILRGGRIGTLLNILIIAMVFTNMILLSAIIGGAVNLFHEQTVDYITSDIVIKPDQDERTILNVDELLERVNRVPGVSRASARYALGATLGYKGSSVSIPITAFNPRDEVEVTRIHTRVIEGDFLSPGDDGILLGQLVAGHEDSGLDFYDSLGGVAVGDSITVMYANGVSREYRIKGLFSTKSYQADYMAFISWEEMNTVLGTRNTGATEVLVRTVSGEDPLVVKMRLLTFGVQERVETWEEAMTQIIADSMETFSIIDRISLAVSLIIAIVVIGIVFTIKTINQRRQIGIQKAIGISNRIIIGSYVAQVLFIWLFGSLAGMVVVNLLLFYFSANPLEFPDGDVVPVFEMATMLENVAWLAAASALAGFLPAWRITRENTLDAMRG
ncbi:FtsX-like permease family protein [Methanocalculus sp.]|uniref:ABC transporter permease n=1 Tax=Methanocalculus sp. TaxID=2004547 RepID=UPI00272028C3|nr:FtsX-like permease family protein [Methanocalculus sp.]MDO8841951.1 FtsX-like permease family protein [Methanocalculus sp.]